MLPNLKTYRKKVAISQQALADAIGVSQQSINQYENHSVEPDIAVLCRLADYFHSTIDDLVGRTPVGELDIQARLSRAEMALLGKYRTLSPREQQCVETVIDTLLNKS